jgi:hypothetical protein
MTVPVQPVVRLSAEEVKTVANFAKSNNFTAQDTVILFECSSTSGQSFVTVDFALEAAKHVLSYHADVKFVLTSDKKVLSPSSNIIDASVLGFKENAELTKYCSLLVGCSSGISWLATSDWAKKLPTIQLLSSKTHMFASMIQDAKYFGLPIDHIIEMQNCTPQHLAECIVGCLKNSFAETKKIYHVDAPVKFDFYFQGIYSVFLKKMDIANAVKSIGFAFERYHYDEQGIEDLSDIIKNIFFPYLHIFWNRVEEKDKREIIGIINYRPQSRPTKISYWKSVVSIAIRVFKGKHTFIAKIFLKDIILKLTHTEKFFE